MAYVTRVQFEDTFGHDETVDLLSNGADFEATEQASASLADGYLASRYALPLAAVPDMLRGWVQDITRYRLWDEHAPDEVRRRYEDAIAQLRDVAAGRIALPPAGGVASTAPPLQTEGFCNTRVFTQDSLACF